MRVFFIAQVLERGAIGKVDKSRKDFKSFFFPREMPVPNGKVELSCKQGFGSGRLHGRFRPLRFCFRFQNAVHFSVAVLPTNLEAVDRFQKPGGKVWFGMVWYGKVR